MTRRPIDERAMSVILAGWLDERAAAVGTADEVIGAVAARTAAMRPVPRWRERSRWLPERLVPRAPQLARTTSLVVLVALLIALAIAAAIYIGSQRRLPPPFGPAANGDIAFVSDGHVAVAAADGSGRTVITSGDSTQSTPVFSRDGTRIAWIEGPPPGSTRPAARCLVIANADGSAAVSIDPNCDGMSPPSWSADGRFVVYSRGFAPGIEQVYVAASDGSSPPRRIGDPTQHSWGPGWSPNGHTISFIQHDPTTDREQIALIEADGSGRRILTEGPWDRILGVEWRPDAGMLAFPAGSDDKGYAIWTVALDGRATRLPIPHGLSEDGPVWSPDGSRIAYLHREADRLATVHVATLDGSDRALAGTYQLAPIGWSPDGTKVFITAASTTSAQVAILDASGTSPPARIDMGPATYGTLSDPPPASWQRLAP
jgi:Tol biopolymer transport system component